MTTTTTAAATPPVLLSFGDVLRIPVMRRVWYAQVVSLFGDFLALFAVIAVLHLLRTVAEWPRLGADPWFILVGPGLGVVSAALSYWAWRLLRLSLRS